MAVSRDWAAVSAPFDTASTGKVSLYRLDGVRDGGSPEPDVELTAWDKEPLTRFGASVAADGDLLVAGAPKDRDNVGSAYVFRYDASEGEWMEAAKLEPPQGEASADSQGNFGHGVAVSAEDGVVVVAAPYDGTQGRRRNGSVFVFERSSSSSTSYVLVQKIVPFELLGGDQFGSALAIETSVNPSDGARETRIAVGARLRDDRGIDSGAAYVYLRKETVLGEFALEQKLVSSDWSPGAEMGASVAMRNRRIVVGARKQDGSGGAHFFRFDGARWAQNGAVATPPSGKEGDDFGSAVVLTSEVALIGANLNDGVGEDGGKIYSYEVCDG